MDGARRESGAGETLAEQGRQRDGSARSGNNRCGGRSWRSRDRRRRRREATTRPAGRRRRRGEPPRQPRQAAGQREDAGTGSGTALGAASAADRPSCGVIIASAGSRYRRRRLIVASGTGKASAGAAGPRPNEVRGRLHLHEGRHGSVSTGRAIAGLSKLIVPPTGHAIVTRECATETSAESELSARLAYRHLDGTQGRCLPQPHLLARCRCRPNRKPCVFSQRTRMQVPSSDCYDVADTVPLVAEGVSAAIGIRGTCDRARAPRPPAAHALHTADIQPRRCFLQRC